MDNFYDWKPEHSIFFITIITVLVGFSTYWFLAMSEKIKALFFKTKNTEEAWVKYVVFQKLTGALFIGLIPGIILLSISNYSLDKLGLKLGNYPESIVYIIVIGIVFSIINYFASKNPLNLSNYPQMRLSKWTNGRISLNSLAWAIYLFAYEFMIRGALLMVCYDNFGFWPAVAINLLFYSATHIAKGLNETIGSFPYGFLLCYITISTGSIAVAFFTHLILALTNDYFSVYHNPDMSYV